MNNILLTDFLSLVAGETFITVQWSVSKEPSYRGCKSNFCDYTEDAILVSVTESKEDGLVLTIDIKKGE